MLPSQPRVCLVWMRSKSSEGLSWEWVSHHLHDGLLGSLPLGPSHCAWNSEATALNIAFLLLHGGRYADKIGTRLEGQRERNLHFGACRHLRATQKWMQWSFLSSFSSWKSPSLGTGVPGSQVFTNLPAAKVSHTPQGSVSHFLDEVDYTCTSTLVPDWGSMPISGQVAQRWLLLRMMRLPLMGRVMQLSGDVHGSWSQDWEL